VPSSRPRAPGSGPSTRPKRDGVESGVGYLWDRHRLRRRLQSHKWPLTRAFFLEAASGIEPLYRALQAVLNRPPDGLECAYNGSTRSFCPRSQSPSAALCPGYGTSYGTANVVDGTWRNSWRWRTSATERRSVDSPTWALRPRLGEVRCRRSALTASQLLGQMHHKAHDTKFRGRRRTTGPVAAPSSTQARRGTEEPKAGGGVVVITSLLRAHSLPSCRTLAFVVRPRSVSPCRLSLRPAPPLLLPTPRLDFWDRHRPAEPVKAAFALTRCSASNGTGASAIGRPPGRSFRPRSLRWAGLGGWAGDLGRD
jgi:hypothetical protein